MVETLYREFPGSLPPFSLSYNTSSIFGWRGENRYELEVKSVCETLKSISQNSSPSRQNQGCGANPDSDSDSLDSGSFFLTDSDSDSVSILKKIFYDSDYDSNFLKNVWRRFRFRFRSYRNRFGDSD